MLSKEYSESFFLGAGETDAQGTMPLWLIAQRAIELATAHANSLGIGYATLIKRNIGWVLSRLSIETLIPMPINTQYTVTTWIESYNRRFSERNFAITGADGTVYAYVRSIWSAIDYEKRTGADISAVAPEGLPISDRECPILPAPRIGELGPEAARRPYTFRYCDLDFNRHVNTVRLIELILNQWPLQRYDAYEPVRLDVLFHHESTYGQTVEVLTQDLENRSLCELVLDGIRQIGAAITWRRR